MICCIHLTVSCLLAIWFSYWFSRSFRSLQSRSCLITFIGLPLLLSVLLMAFPTGVLQPVGDYLTNLDVPGFRGQSTVIIVFAIFLTGISLLMGALVGQYSAPKGARSTLD